MFCFLEQLFFQGIMKAVVLPLVGYVVRWEKTE